jgi:hypothetical protein
MPRSNIGESEMTTTSAFRSSLWLLDEGVEIRGADFLLALEDDP